MKKQGKKAEPQTGDARPGFTRGTTSGYVQQVLASAEQCHAMARDLTVCSKELNDASARYKERPTDENARECIRCWQNMRHAAQAAMSLDLGAPGSWITLKYNYQHMPGEGAWLPNTSAPGTGSIR